MAKDTERKLAEILYINQNKTAKEIAVIVSVNESTVGDWVKKFSWKQRRDAKAIGSTLEDDYKDLLSNLLEKRQQMSEDENSNAKDRYKLSCEIRMLSKDYEKMKSEDGINLEKYLSVMDSIFEAIRAEQPKLFMKLLDFQNKHINETALKFT